MGWFGRKSAPDMRPFVPAWLKTDEQPGFARSYDAQFEEVYRRNPVGQRAVRQSTWSPRSRVMAACLSRGYAGPGWAGYGHQARICLLGRASSAIEWSWKDLGGRSRSHHPSRSLLSRLKRWRA